MKIIRFTASWCGPCKMYAPIFESATRKMPNVTTQVVDVDQEPALALKYGIRSVPTTIVLDDNGKLKERVVGVVDENRLLSLVK